jgi:hypothetical protein
MIRRTPRRRRVRPIEAHFRQIESIDKHVDHANRVAFVNEIIEAFGQQRRLPAIRLFNEAPHKFPPQNHERILANQKRFHIARVIFGPRLQNDVSFPDEQTSTSASTTDTGLRLER